MGGGEQLEFPGYATNRAPKERWPALCSTLGRGEAAAPGFNCSVGAEHVQRLCPCGPAAPEAPAVVAAAEGGGGEQVADGAKAGDEGGAAKAGDAR